MSICGDRGITGNSSVNWFGFPSNDEEPTKKKTLEESLAANSVMFAASMQANATQK